MQGNSAGISRQGYDGRFGPSLSLASVIEIGKTSHAGQALEKPEDTNGFDDRQLRKFGNFAMDPRAKKCDEGKNDVHREEGFVESVSDRRKREDNDQRHRDCSCSSPANECVGTNHVPNARPP